MIFPRLHIGWERWKWNDEYGIWVSTFGNFKTDKKKDMKVKTNERGYLCVKSYKAAKYILAHRLVMMTWRPCADVDSMTVDHLDHNKRNNRLSNLEWVTYEENLRRATEDRTEEPKPKKQKNKIKFVPTAYTLEHFYLCCNGLYFTEVEEVWTYMKTQDSNIGKNLIINIDKTFRTLLNAYNNQNPVYVANGFMKENHGYELSIVKKGA